MSKRRLSRSEILSILDFIPQASTEPEEAVRENIFNDLYSQLEVQEIYPDKNILDKLKEKLKSVYYSSLLHPGQAVGVDSALAQGEPVSQATLNSIDYNDRINIKRGYNIFFPRIGELVDTLMDKEKPVKVGESEYLDITHLGYYTVSVNSKGKVYWKLIEAVTRHPPSKDVSIGVDNPDKLLRVETFTGRVVFASKAKSFLTREKNIIKETRGSDIRVGTRLPITLSLPPTGYRIESLNLTEYLYRNDLVLSDIKLDKSFAEFISSYLTSAQSSRGKIYFYYLEKGQEVQKVQELWLRENNIQFDIHGSEILVTDRLWIDLLESICGSGSCKHLPPFIFCSNFSFIKFIILNLIEFDKDESSFISSSEELIDGVLNLLSIYSILVEKRDIEFNSGEKIWSITVSESNNNRLFRVFKSSNTQEGEYTFHKEDIIPGIHGEMFRGDFHRDVLLEIKDNLNIVSSRESELLSIAIDSEVFFDRVVDIREVSSSKPLVYDLTVKDTKNFSLSNGLHIRDTFHLSGFNAANVTLGIPRFNEILNTSKKQKTNIINFKLVKEIDVSSLKKNIEQILREENVKSFKSDLQFRRFIFSDEKEIYRELKEVQRAGLTPRVSTRSVEEEYPWSLRYYSPQFTSSTLKKIYTGLKCPEMMIFFSDKEQFLDVWLKSSCYSLQETRDVVRENFEELFVDQIISSHTLQKNRVISEEDLSWYNLFTVLHSFGYEKYTWSIRLVLDKLKMVQHKISPEKVARRIEEEYGDCFCVFSPVGIGIIDVYVDTDNIDSPELIISLKKKHNEDMSCLITDENKDYFFMKGVAMEYILNIQLGGIEGIIKGYYKREKDEWTVECAGTNLRALLSCPQVDSKTVLSNNIWEVLSILGIEAARQVLLAEINSVISFGGTFVDPVHPTLLVDSMTCSRSITSVNRYGIRKGNNNVFTQTTFEKSHQTLLDAHVKGLTDDLSSVSGAIITGKHMRIGTGYMQLLFDDEKIKEPTDDIPSVDIQEITEYIEF